MWPTLPADKFRHRDHRFEWTRAEFQEWANRVANQEKYVVHFAPVGPEDETVGSPTQMAIFDREEKIFNTESTERETQRTQRIFGQD